MREVALMPARAMHGGASLFFVQPDPIRDNYATMLLLARLALRLRMREIS